MDEIRTEPGIKLMHLFACTFFSSVAVWSGSLFFLLLSVYLWFSAIVVGQFWPNLTDEEIAEIRRQQWMEKRSEYDNKDSDLQERPPEDTDRD